MKKIILLSVLIASTLGFNYTYANGTNEITVQVTEKMPWMEGCWDNLNKWKKDKNWNDLTPLYECTIKPGFWSVQKMLAWIIKYFTFIAWIGWVLFLVINGIMYSMWDKEEAKKRIIKTLTWLIVLFCSWVILNLVAPWIYK